jgi:hypothetical protein
MCDPLSAAGLALAVGGGAVTGISNQNYVEAVNRENKKAAEISRQARLAEQMRQKKYEGQASDKWMSGLEGATQPAMEEDAATASDSLMNQFEDYRAADNVAGQFLSGQDIPTGSTEVKTEAARKVAEATMEAKQRIAALFNLTGDATAQGEVKRGFGDTNNFLSTLNNIRRGSLGVSQQEQAIPAATVEQGWGPTIGSIMSGIGGMTIKSPNMFSGVSSLWSPAATPAGYDFRMGFASPAQRA